MGFVGLSGLVYFVSLLTADPKAISVVKVNGVVISQSDVDFAAFQQGVSATERPEAEPKLVEQLIDRQLVRAYLAARKIEPLVDELQFQIVQTEDLIRKRGEDPQTLLPKLGYSPERLKSELGLPLAWQVYAKKTITPQQVKDYFEKHKQELDGTQLRGSHIFLKRAKPASDDDTTAKKEKLENLRREILDNQITFAEAAKKHSEAPTAQHGGDIGLFGWKGKLPPVVSQAAFALKVNEISEPVVSPLGVHLIQVTERHPGDFSLEDVRTVIVEKLSQQLWNETIAKERMTAKIERAAK